jgi:hypothetical protein
MATAFRYIIPASDDTGGVRDDICETGWDRAGGAKYRKENVFSATMEWKRNETAFSYIKRVSNKVFTDFVLPEATFFLETPDLL